MDPIAGKIIKQYKQDQASYCDIRQSGSTVVFYDIVDFYEIVDFYDINIVEFYDIVENYD